MRIAAPTYTNNKEGPKTIKLIQNKLFEIGGRGGQPQRHFHYWPTADVAVDTMDIDEIMGYTSFLTGNSGGAPQSLDEALFQLENSSLVFLASWLRVPQDLERAGRVSIEAMRDLDHVVNEILRARDTLKGAGTYSTSSLKVQLDASQGVLVSPVTRMAQNLLISAGPGNGVLPVTGVSISLEKLLNKIKHRHHASSNFRIGTGNRHILLINVDTPAQQPDSIVEFDISDFCTHCRLIAPLI